MEPDIRTKWHYSFQWTDNHLPREETGPLKQEYDQLGDAVLEKLQVISAQNSKETGGQGGRPKLDLYALLRDNHETDTVLHQFWTELHTVPSWVDWEQLERAQKFFYRYAAANLTGFALQGFMGENSAASGVIEVFVRTGGFSTKILLHRLMETFQWLLQVTHSLPSIQPGGDGHASSVRVRLLHCSVRQRIMKLAQTRPDYFNTQKWGVPINTLDCIHSITVFCCLPMWFQLPKMGIKPTQQEIDDYIALFRYVAYLLATPPEYFETSEKAKAVMETMYLHELEPTDTSKVVGYNFVKCLEDMPPMNISSKFIEAGSRWFNGDELCDLLDIGRPGWYYYACFRGLCLIVMTMAFLQRLVPRFDRLMINYWRDLLHNIIIHSKSGLGKPTVFEFKYVPQFGKHIGKEDLPSAHEAGESKRLSRPAESFLFAVFLLGGALVVAFVWAVLKICIFAYGHGYQGVV